jgi:photosystem II stability/assembly factor-like uncharacterized protein
LIFGETYYWQVRAIEGQDTSFWTEARSFTVLNAVTLSKPTLLSNQNLPPNQEVEWSLIDGATNFEIQYDTTFFLKQIDADVSVDLNGVFTFAENNVYAVGNGGLVIHYDGTTTTTLDAGTTEDLKDVFFVNENLGWVVGDNGAIFKYDGTDWTDETPAGTIGMFNTIDMLSETMGYVGGVDMMLYTYDGSAWTAGETLVAPINDLAFLNADFGFAVGDDGMIEMFDAGTWTDQTSGTKDFYAVSILSTTNVWTVGKSGKVFNYNGAEWIEAETSNNKDMYCLNMFNTSSGYALGKGGVLTIFNGTDWQTSTSMQANSVLGISMVGGVGYAVGEGGLVLDFSSDAFNSPYAHTANIVNNDSTDSYQMSNLLFGENIFWRVRVYHTEDTSAWSAPWYFSVLDSVILTSPEVGTIQDLIVKLKWRLVEGVIGYRAEIATEETFADPESYFVDSTSIILEKLNFGLNYFWRVQAIHEAGASSWREPFTFPTVNTVTLTSPNNNSTGVNVLPLLDWDSIAGVNYYHLQFADNPEMDDLLYDETFNAKNHDYQIQYKLEELKDYYWRVKAITTQTSTPDTSLWSSTFKLTTEEGIGIMENEFASKVDIFPNPSSGTLNLNLTLENAFDAELTIVDFIGNTHVSKSLQFKKGLNHTTLDLSGLVNGIYFIKLQSSTASMTQKLVIDK